MGLGGKLFSVALESYLRNRRHKEITERLNRVYADEANADERQARAAMKLKAAAIAKDRW